MKTAFNRIFKIKAITYVQAQYLRITKKKIRSKCKPWISYIQIVLMNQ
mgnify:CR=1 FL=1